MRTVDGAHGTARSTIRPPHRGHRQPTSPKTCHSSHAHVRYRVLPRFGDADSASVSGSASSSGASGTTSRRHGFTVTPPAAGLVAFQGVVLGLAGAGATPVLQTEVAAVDVTWSYDLVEVTVDQGESAYFFGMAETDSGYGWYGEDCSPFTICHPMGSSLLLTSEHPDVGGIGIPGVVSGLTTLFYDTHAPAITYYLEGLDTGDCFAWGHDPAYYPSCMPLN